MDEKLRFSMAGSGNWRRLFPNNADQLYLQIYKEGGTVKSLSIREQEIAESWVSAGFVSLDHEVIHPEAPILIPADMERLQGWFCLSAEAAAAVIAAHMPEYEALAQDLSVGQVSRENIMAMLIYAQTLDVGTLDKLQEGIMGFPPERTGSDAYFFWGQTIPMEGRVYYGVNSFGTDHFQPRYIHSEQFERRAENRRSMTIPVFDAKAMGRIKSLCGGITRRLAHQFTARLDNLDHLLAATSFANCNRPDVLCMIFHWGYGEIASALKKQGIMPEFPKVVDDGWGFWVEWQ